MKLPAHLVLQRDLYSDDLFEPRIERQVVTHQVASKHLALGVAHVARRKPPACYFAPVDQLHLAVGLRVAKHETVERISARAVDNQLNIYWGWDRTGGIIPAKTQIRKALFIVIIDELWHSRPVGWDGISHRLFDGEVHVLVAVKRRFQQILKPSLRARY